MANAGDPAAGRPAAGRIAGSTREDIHSQFVYPVVVEGAMRVAKWGNSLAVRIPAVVVEALGLEEGDDIELHAVGARALEVRRRPAPRELVARLRRFRGRLPADFRFDRLEAHERR
jgi:antitoxin MazE